MLGCPVAGIDAGEIIDATPEIRQTAGRYLGDAAFSNLPRKFKTAMSGCAAQCTVHEINDVAFVGVPGPDGQPGYDLWVGGGLSTNPKIGVRLGVFVKPGQVAEVWAGGHLGIQGLRVPAAAAPGAAEVPARRLGRRAGSARSWRRSTWATRCRTARRRARRERAGVTMSACTASGTACTT